MNKFLLIAIIACSIASVYAWEGGYHKVDYVEANHGVAFKAAISHLTQQNMLSSNGIFRPEAFYEKIVSGSLYKFVIREGKNIFEVEVWSQPWVPKLEVVSAKKVSNNQ